MKLRGYRSGTAGGVSCAPSASSAEEFERGTGFSSRDSEGDAYQLLNASGQEEAARANLSNARAVQEAAEERLNLYRIADEALLVTVVRPAR